MRTFTLVPYASASAQARQSGRIDAEDEAKHGFRGTQSILILLIDQAPWPVEDFVRYPKASFT